MNSQYDEITLSAYIDGELDSETMHAVEMFIQENDDARRYIFEAVKVNAHLRASMNASLHAEIPQRLMNAVNKTPAKKSGRFAPLLRIAAAIVLVLVGVGGGTLINSQKDLPFSAVLAPFSTRYSQVIEEALENNVSGTSRQWQEPRSAHSVAVTPVKTYRDKQGIYYREYRLEVTSANESRQLNGLAYRDVDGKWQTKILYF